MVWLIIATFIDLFIGLAALVRSLRLEGAKKIIFSVLSGITLALTVIAFVGELSPSLSTTFVKVFVYSGLGLGIITLSLAVYFLRKLYNKVFTDKTKEHQESVANILAKEKEQQENKN